MGRSNLTFLIEVLLETRETLGRDVQEGGFTLIKNPETKVYGFGLPQILWTTLNRVRTEKCRCKRLLNKSEKINKCGTAQINRQIVEVCPNTKFEREIAKLHQAGTENVN